MMNYKYYLVFITCFLLVNPIHAWSSRRIKKKLRKLVKNTVKSIGKGVCKALFGFVCPVMAVAASIYMANQTTDAETEAFRVASAWTGVRKCHVARRKCKRRRDAAMKMLAFSDNFADYDSNEDKVISYEEFVYSVMRSVDLADASELEQPFSFADSNGDDDLNTSEFLSAPFLFADVNFSQQGHKQYKIKQQMNTTHEPEVTSPIE